MLIVKMVLMIASFYPEMSKVHIFPAFLRNSLVPPIYSATDHDDDRGAKWFPKFMSSTAKAVTTKTKFLLVE